MRVCVVGAGFAGLAAGWALHRAGTDVVLFEARDRVGGRVHSVELGNGTVVERGGEFVEHDQPVLAGLVAEVGLRLVPTGVRYGRREPRGGRGVDAAVLTAELDRFGALVAARTGMLHGRSVAEVLAGMPLDPAVREVIAARVQVSAAQPVERLAATSLAHAGSTFAPNESLHISAGNQSLARRLADRLGGAVRLQSPVTGVRWSPGGVRVRIERPGAGAEVVAADRCLLAVPASVLDRGGFDPPLPAWKTAALARVAYGQAAKLFVPLRAPTVPSAVLSVPELFWTWTHRAADGSVAPAVSAFAGSAPALDRLGVASGPARWLDRLAALRPELALDPAGALLATWDDDPWARGAYSTRVPESRAGDDELLTRPVGPVHFAGEHTAGPWAGMMEGALRSGQRAAAEITGGGCDEQP